MIIELRGSKEKGDEINWLTKKIKGKERVIEKKKTKSYYVIGPFKLWFKAYYL